MAYDRELANRIRGCLGDAGPYDEKAMFGGLAFLVDGNMAVAASGTGALMARVDPEAADDLLGNDAEPMVMRGRPMRGWLLVPVAAVGDDDVLQQWVDRCVAFARTLPPK